MDWIRQLAGEMLDPELATLLALGSPAGLRPLLLPLGFI